MSYSDYDSYEAYDDARWEAEQDAREDARREEWLENATQCPWCKTYWDQGYHRATRIDPAYVDHPECPDCGMSPEEAQCAADMREENCA